MSESKVEILNIGRNKMNHHVMVEFTFGETKANTHLSATRYVTDEEVETYVNSLIPFCKELADEMDSGENDDI